MDSWDRDSWWKINTENESGARELPDKRVTPAPQNKFETPSPLPTARLFLEPFLPLIVARPHLCSYFAIAVQFFCFFLADCYRRSQNQFLIYSSLFSPLPVSCCRITNLPFYPLFSRILTIAFPPCQYVSTRPPRIRIPSRVAFAQ